MQNLTQRETQRKAFFEYLTHCHCPQGKTTNWPEKKANEWIRTLNKLEKNEVFIHSGVDIESVFDITSPKHAKEVYEVLQKAGLAGTTGEKAVVMDSHCQTSAPFLAYYSMLQNQEYFKNHCAWGETVPTPEEEDAITQKCFKLLQANKNLVLTGAPGTGKTYLAKKVARLFNAVTEFVQFHPSYDYTDFVEGLRPVKGIDNKELVFVRKDGVFKAFCKSALDNPDRNYVLIIDEINRGEFSKILGELFYSIDPDYRGKEQGTVKTQYQNMIDSDDVFADGFFVPENVYILATMNDIDRSVESMDFAIRRRFSWLEIIYTDTKDSILSSCQEIQEFLGVVDKRLKNINNAMLNQDLHLGSAYQLGASYFTKLKKYDDVTDVTLKFANLWSYHIKGVLVEYLRGSEDPESGLKLLEDAYNLSAEYTESGDRVSLENQDQ